MKLNKRLISIGLGMAVIVLSSFSYGVAQTDDTAEILTVSTKERRSIEIVIKDYLLANPSIIRDAMQALEIQEKRQAAERAAESMKSFKQAIFEDKDSPVVGNPKGDVSVVVFFDYNCGYCKQTLPALSGIIANDPSLRVVYKEFPNLGATSQVAAQAALAAARQGKYAEFHDELMKSESADEASVKNISDRLGLNYKTLKKDMADPALNEALMRNLNLAEALGIGGTPSYIVGDQIVPGAIDAASLERLISNVRAEQLKSKPDNSTGGAK